MKDPEKLLDKFSAFTVKIENESFRKNFSTEAEYLKFLENLEELARDLHSACFKLLVKYNII